MNDDDLPYVDFGSSGAPKAVCTSALVIGHEALALWRGVASREGQAGAATSHDDGDVWMLESPAQRSEQVWVSSVSPKEREVRDSITRWVQIDAQVRSWCWMGGEWLEESVVVAPSPDAVFDRNRGLIESSRLKEKCVAIVGLGSGGSMIASHLVRAGVGRFVLVDRDRLEVHNVGRHVCGLDDLGRRKTRAMRDHILSRNPVADVRIFEGDIVTERDRFLPILEGCDAIVGATDNNASRRVINRYAVENGVPAIFGRAYVRACGGDAIAVRPNGPCYNCLFQGGGPEEEVSSASSEQASAYADVEVVAEPGLAMDVAPIALFCARLTLAELTRGMDDLSIATLNEDLEAALYLWGNRRDGQFSGWKPLGFSPSGLRVQRWYGMRAAVRPDCDVCRPEAFLASLRERAEPQDTNP